jgi:hypothetical protein
MRKPATTEKILHDAHKLFDRKGAEAVAEGMRLDVLQQDDPWMWRCRRGRMRTP